jgi:arsenate reductase
MLTVYGIKSCDTCRRARKFLEEHAIEFRFHDVRDDGLEIQKLERWAARIDWQKLLNRKSVTWRKIPEADRANMTRERAFVLMLEHPTLLKRPLLESPEFIAVGFSEARFTDFLKRTAAKR